MLLENNRPILSQRVGLPEPALPAAYVLAGGTDHRYLVTMLLGVIGTGRFGKFWAELLAERHTVVTYNRSDRAVPAGCKSVALDQLGECDAIFLCTAISSIVPVLQQLSPHLRPGAVVLDTCSVKVYPTRSMREILPESVECIGTHPMFGPDSARNGVEGLPLVFAPVRCSEGTASLWRREFVSMGLVVSDLDPEAHDREAAYTQGVTHFVGRVLADMALAPSDIATVGYQQLLAVMEQTCNDPYQLFEDLQRFNPYTTQMRQQLQHSLTRLLESLESSVDSRLDTGT
jgi:prephenate dehydrogenase